MTFPANFFTLSNVQSLRECEITTLNATLKQLLDPPRDPNLLQWELMVHAELCRKLDLERIREEQAQETSQGD